MDIWFTRSIRHGADRLHTALAPSHHWAMRPLGINIGTYNIRYGWAFGLPEAIWVVLKGNYDIIILTKTKVQDEMYCWNRLGYDVYCLLAMLMEDGGAKGGVGIVSIERPEGWLIELMRFHDPNVVNFELMMGNIWMPVIRAYLPSSMIEILLYIEKTLNPFPDGDPILLGDLNEYIVRLHHHCNR